MTKISESEIIRNKNGIEHGTAQCFMHKALIGVLGSILDLASNFI